MALNEKKGRELLKNKIASVYTKFEKSKQGIHELQEKWSSKNEVRVHQLTLSMSHF